MKAPKFSPIIWTILLCGLGAAGIGIFLLASKKPWNVDLKPGAALRIHDFVVIYEWWAAAINLLLLVLLALSARWWLRPSHPSAAAWLPEQTTPRWFWPLVIAAMALRGMMLAVEQPTLQSAVAVPDQAAVANDFERARDLALGWNSRTNSR